TVFWLGLLPVLLTGSIVHVDSTVPPLVGVSREHMWTVPVVLGGLILAWGAAITSLGLALAVTMASLTRAVATSVCAYASLSFGGLCVVVALSRRRHEGLLTPSPFFGSTVLTASLRERAPGEHFCLVGSFCVVGFFAVAVVLYVGVLLSFNYFMGRMSGRRRV